ncbi:unnamed protein product [Oikopleura dioica]|uniref:Uncharacterized protein n=1 Tax=Oikopleura dioica TaxID=34765 RepID=E4WQJ6_OIKDI|nr:unnamed protein product [Oikopleura dioica]
MADSDSLIFPSKKRKLEEENYEEPLLEPPLQENLLPESQLSGSQTVVTDIFDLTLVEQESEKLEDRFVWKKIELQSVTSMLQKLDRSNVRGARKFLGQVRRGRKISGKTSACLAFEFSPPISNPDHDQCSSDTKYPYTNCTT